MGSEDGPNPKKCKLDPESVTADSEFLSLKNEGNGLFKLACEGKEDLTPSSFREKMQEAIAVYYNALKSAASAEQASSAEKNLAMAYAKIAEKFLQDGNGQTNVSLSFFRAAMFHFQSAWSKGRLGNSQTYDWVVALEGKIDFYAKLAWAGARDSEAEASKEQQNRVHAMATAMDRPGNLTRARLFYHRAVAYFHDAIKLQEAGGVENFRSSKVLLSDAEQYISEAEACVPTRVGAVDELEELKSDIYTHKCISESAAAKERGLEFMKSAVDDAEYLDVNGVFVAMDFFREAIVLSRGKDIPLEAEACSHLGGLYVKILREEPKARQYFKQSIELAQSVMSEKLNDSGWLKFAKSCLEDFQKKDVAKERAEYEKQRGPTLEKLKPVLEALELEKDRGATHFLDHIYEKHPPRRASKKDESNEGDGDLRKRLRHALVDYHPDKQEFKGDFEWVVLCEEITKRLNNFYAMFKGC